MSKMTCKRGDTLQTITDIAKLAGALLGLSGASIVAVFRDGSSVLRRPAIIVDLGASKMGYKLEEVVTGEVKIWRFVWEITLTDGVVTSPSKGYNLLIVEDDLG